MFEPNRSQYPGSSFSQCTRLEKQLWVGCRVISLACWGGDKPQCHLWPSFCVTVNYGWKIHLQQSQNSLEYQVVVTPKCIRKLKGGKASKTSLHPAHIKAAFFVLCRLYRKDSSGFYNRVPFFPWAIVSQASSYHTQWAQVYSDISVATGINS